MSMPVAALDLVDAYNLAVDHDPVLRHARLERDSGFAGRAVERAGLLPQLQLSYMNAPTNDQEVWYPARNAQSEPIEGYERRDYNSYAAVLRLQQPLFDLEAWARYRQAAAQALFADEWLRAGAQELAVRVLTAYTDVLFAQDHVALVVAQQHTLREQQQFNQRLFDEGEGTRTDLIETQARHEIAAVQGLEARDALQAARHSLEALIGMPVTESLAPLLTQFEALALTPATFEEWQQIALDHNPMLAAQRHNIEALSQEILRRRSGHLPKLVAYVSRSRTRSDTPNTYEQRYDTRTIGLQVTMSLFAGGGVAASAHQATLNREAARAELDAQTAETLTDLRRQFDVCRNAPAKIRAYERAVQSAQLLIEATRRSVESGTRVNLDVLDAEQQLSQSRRDLAEARYTYLIAQLQLHRLAGVLEADDLQRVAELFAPEPAVRPGSAARVTSGPPVSPHH